jgi:flagellar basal body-associated protein FliL
MSAKTTPPDIPEYVSQADIDALLQGAGTADAPAEETETPQPATADADEVAISQADIDALLQGAGAADAPAGETETPQPATADAVEVTIPQADIDALLQGAGTSGDPAGEAEAPQPAAADADEVAISQADIDALLQGAGAADAPAEETETPQPATADADEVTIPQADIDLLHQSAPAPAQGHPSGPSPGADRRSFTAEGEGGEEIFISQADIDALMASEVSLEEDPVDPARPSPPVDPAPLCPDQAEAGGLSTAASGRESAGPQKVILAPADEEQSPVLRAPEDQQPAAKRRFSPKTLWPVAAVLLILISTVTSFYFYGRQTPSRGAGGGPQSFPIPRSSESAQAGDPSGPAQVALTGFVVPAPPDKAEVAGLLVDVQLVFADAAAGSEIQQHEPYLRSLVYGVLFDTLADRDQPEIDEPALADRIKDALNRALPRGNIHRAALENLRLL